MRFFETKMPPLATIETVECANCCIETQLHAIIYDDEWSMPLCPECFEEAKKNNNDRRTCFCCGEELVVEEDELK